MNQPDTHSRHYSSVDRLIVRIQQHFSPRTAPTTPSPAEEFQDEPLTPAEQRHSAGLMRVNHAGEVAAQGLYIGQAATAREDSTADLLRQAGRDELDHLRWCQERLAELSAKPSALTPLWHGGAVAIGMLNGLGGDRWSLGFVAETERQVEKHLSSHLPRLPASDHRSRAIIERMIDDEAGHRMSANAAGGRALPWPMKVAMRLSAKVMTTTAYRL